jgi:hypothetical protein
MIRLTISYVCIGIVTIWHHGKLDCMMTSGAAPVTAFARRFKDINSSLMETTRGSTRHLHICWCMYSFIHPFIASLNMFLFSHVQCIHSFAWCVVLGNVWSNTRRLLKEQGVIPKTNNSVKAEKFRESYFRDRKNHKNYKVKEEKPAEEERPAEAPLPSTSPPLVTAQSSVFSSSCTIESDMLYYVPCRRMNHHPHHHQHLLQQTTM